MTRVVDVLANIGMLPHGVSGKTQGYRSGVRPNHFFGNDTFSVIGVMTFESTKVLDPGMNCAATVRFVWPEARDAPSVGERWRIQKGSRLVAEGQIVEVLNDSVL